MATTPLRILFISGFFPPHAPMGAVRTGKLEEFWREEGHDIRTIAIDLPWHRKAREQPPGLVEYVSYEEPGKIVTRVKSAIVRSRLGRFISTLRPRSSRRVTPSQTQRPPNANSIRKLGLIDVYRQMLMVPDRYKYWIGPATQLGLSWSEIWKPDVIYSSGPPHSSNVVAANLSERLRVPWIAELRDLWIGDPYFDSHYLARPLQERLAMRTLSQATAFVVVTNDARERLRSIFNKPVTLSYNGYDPKDFAGLADVEPLDPERLTIVHAGTIYPGRRDPTPLFEAISFLGEQRDQIRCLFYADTSHSVAALAERHGISQCVEILNEVPRSQILRVERQADILLECRWQDRAGDGVIPGKLFEYIGARRPILSLGSLTGEAAEIVRENNFGLASNEPNRIRTLLLESLAIKARLRRLPDRATDADTRFLRETQFHKVERLIGDILESH